MAVYFVTGKLGGGKSLVSVHRIKMALYNGAPIATNIDLNLKNMIGRHSKKCRVFRLPDKPTVGDFKAIGNGNKTYDESKNGLIVLDECGTWFNSRSWADKSRQDVINWMLHARKLGWDIIFIVQDISIVDKQARLALGEHVVYCRRMDRLTIPFIGTIYRLITGSKLPLPKIHMGVVKYGDGQNAMVVDKWTMMGLSLYNCYDTKQAFSDFYEHGIYTVLPPYYTHGRYSITWTVKNQMRITKIYFKKYSKILMFSVGALLAYSYAWFTAPEPVPVPQVNTVDVTNQKRLTDLLSGYKITSYSNFPNQPVKFILKNKKGDLLYSDDLNSMGFDFDIKSRCHIIILQGENNESLYCS
ncbi:zonular occludens toxin domain-containing protein [Aliivibrio fischeri]|uniref:Assembly protein n=1 Tax=Aliivibrio fischeri TaxID=668 RepID=A0A844P7Y6_ALIFS|nr:zonular occludens toxin domain-containing protein [Aliivibrio fischeri]MUK51440.1 assembly protein [Aliivibrio fischeri]